MSNDIDPRLLVHQTKMKMADDLRSLKKKMRAIEGIDPKKRSADIIVEAMTGVSNDMGAQAARDLYTGEQNPVAALAKNGAIPFSANGMNPVMHGDWEPVTVLKETRIGKEVEKYRVRNKNTKNSYDRTYNHYNVAAQISAILNETNNPNDKRILRINEWCDKESSLIFETNKMIQKYKQLDEGNVSRRTILKNQIEEKKMTIDGVRSKMGIY